jgi:hypothetical protein
MASGDVVRPKKECCYLFNSPIGTDNVVAYYIVQSGSSSPGISPPYSPHQGNRNSVSVPSEVVRLRLVV